MTRVALAALVLAVLKPLFLGIVLLTEVLPSAYARVISYDVTGHEQILVPSLTNTFKINRDINGKVPSTVAMFFDVSDWKIGCRVDKFVLGFAPSSMRFKHWDGVRFVPMQIAVRLCDVHISSPKAVCVDNPQEFFAGGKRRHNLLFLVAKKINGSSCKVKNRVFKSNGQKSVLVGTSSELQADQQRSNSKQANDDLTDGQENQGERPFSHFLLGLQVIFGTLSFAIGVYGTYETLRDPQKSNTVAKAVVGILAFSFCLVIGYALAFLSVLALVFPV